MTQPAPANWRGVQANRAASTGKTRPSAPNRSKSQPKTRNTKPKPAGACKPTAPPPPARRVRPHPIAPIKPAPSAFEVGVAQARTYASSATPEQLEMRLQQLLLASKFTDAAFLIAASPHLGTRFQTADVVRLMLEQAKSPQTLEQAAQLVRDLQLQQNDALVTLLVNEMVRAMQFGAAMRLAQEMVPGFEQLSASAATAERPCWTPPALIQAMIRAGKFRAALKFSKQFGLLDTFPAPQLVAGMLETRCYEEAVSSVMEMQLFKEFPLEALAVEMMKQRQWPQAVKCMNKLADKDTQVKFFEALVRETAHVGDFVTSIRYLREFKLDQGNGDATMSLLRYLVDAMIAHGEFYKAIKYAIKFKLAKNPLDDAIAAAEAALAAANGEELPPKEEDKMEYVPQYNVELLIRKSIEGGQFHVATTYIKRLRLREKFADELVTIENEQQNRLLEFRQYEQLRLSQVQDPAFQKNLHTLLDDKADDEIVELEPVEVEIVLSEEQEIFPRKIKTQQVEKYDEDESKTTETEEQAPVSDSNKSVQEEQQEPVVAEASQSRFGFARAMPPPEPPLPSVPVVEVSSEDSQPRSKSVPPSRSAPPPGLFNSLEGDSTQGNTQNGAGGFNFADFAKTVQVSGPPPPPNSAPLSKPLQQLPHPPSPQPPQQQQPFLNQQQQGQPMFGRPMPPMPNGQFTNRPPGYPMPPMAPQQNPMYFPRGNMPPGAMQPRGFPQPPPPPPPSSTNGGGVFDVASLAMQFHSNNGSNGSSGLGGFGGPRPPMSYPGAHNGQHFPGMPPFGVPPPLPQSTFKPSMSYTSVTTTRQKK
ncbi:hypothetical protein PHMEG_0002096 [Phytophthora megakarya]|uniref:Uncharacterized protein n=1 Tax=Phytophthora megakarya TaxID=4795 RepID=A0A225X022_9STRA|nr:hypothetical protein PHMEG_0002096 [Phytophthora megakarya]